MPTSTPDRVRQHTAQIVNEQISAETDARVAYYATHLDEIEARLAELDAEWDIERMIEVEATGTIMTGLALGMASNRKWFLLPLFASGMLLLHSIRGTYPMLPLFRRMGIRTASEIAQERYALKNLRGDFAGVDGDAARRPDALFAAARPSAA